jgi:hypothetical protein
MAKNHGGWNVDDSDLSYLNRPDLNACLLMAGFRQMPLMENHFHTWAQLTPPESCLQLLFVTDEGVSIQQQIESALQVGATVYPKITQSCV